MVGNAYKVIEAQASKLLMPELLITAYSSCNRATTEHSAGLDHHLVHYYRLKLEATLVCQGDDTCREMTLGTSIIPC